jgi:energy-coupling factor transporter ATP-binding protein EcfA2
MKVGVIVDKTFMTELRINHVRHLKDITIPLSESQPKHLILTGKNGSGKTSVLKSAVDFLSYAVSDNFVIQSDCLENIAFDEQRLQTASNSESGKLACEGIRNSIAHWNKFLSHWADGVVLAFPSYLNLREKYLKGEYILAYYGDDREIKVQISKNIEKVDLQEVYSLKDHPSQQLVKYLVNLKTTEAFAKTNGNEARAAEIHAWFDRFQNVLRSIYSDDTLELKFDIETFAFTICQAGHDPFDFTTLSMGYAAVFDIIGDLIMRMESKRRYDLEGLVLIDEIETHLHVDLQKKIVPILTQLFPNIQFVLTTHSPFILNSTANAVVYDLEKKLLVKDGLTDLPYEGVVEGYFDTDLLSAELRQKFTEYKEIVQKATLTDEDFARASELETYLDEVPDYLALDFSEEYSRLKLELMNRE